MLHDDLHANLQSDKTTNMKTIVINSQKGGSGKTTLCRVLSVAARPQGDGSGIYVIDLDAAQATLSQWHENRAAEEPRRVELLPEGLEATLAALARAGAAYVFIDTPPHAEEALDDVFRLADLVLVPVKPTPDDLKAAAVTVAKLRALAVPFLFVVTQAIQNTNITVQATAALSHHGAVAPAMLVNRVTYPAAFTDGRTPLEVEPKSSAAKESVALWAYIQNYLHASNQQPRSAVHG
jgi:chromosome partitioning protein